MLLRLHAPPLIAVALLGVQVLENEMQIAKNNASILCLEIESVEGSGARQLATDTAALLLRTWAGTNFTERSTHE